MLTDQSQNALDVDVLMITRTALETIVLGKDGVVSANQPLLQHIGSTPPSRLSCRSSIHQYGMTPTIPKGTLQGNHWPSPLSTARKSPPPIDADVRVFIEALKDEVNRLSQHLPFLASHGL